MRKLATAAMAFSAAIFAANYILPQGWLIYLAAIAAVFAAALVLLRRKWLRGLILAFVFFALGLLHFDHAYRTTVAKAEAFAGQMCSIEAELVSYPDVYDSYCRLEVKLRGGELAGMKALVYDNEKSCAGLYPGQYISLTGTVKPANTVYGESYDTYYSKDIYLKISAESRIKVSGGDTGIRYLPLRISHALSRRIYSIFPTDVSGFMTALLLGDKRLLYNDEAMLLDMTRAGFMHVVAVSGMHVAFLVGLLHFLFGSGRRTALWCIALVWLFVLVTGASPSAVRAGIMQSFLLLAPLIRRENDPPTSLSAALALILLNNPYAAASASLQLSFAAMAGILGFSGRIYEWLCASVPGYERSRVLRYICANTATSAGVMIFTLPLTVIRFGYIPLLSLLSNILGLWAVSFCFCGGWIACALSVLPAAGCWAAWLCSWLARYILLVAKLVSAIPFAALYLENTRLYIWLAACYLLFGVFYFAKRLGWLRFFLPGMAALLSLILVLGWTRAEYSRGRDTLAVIDVGQGQCVAALAGDSSVMIDCGGINSLENAGEQAGRYLLSRGRERLDVLVLTHLHEDHANGVTMLMEMVELDRLILPIGAQDDDELLAGILSKAEECGTAVEYVAADRTIPLEGMNISLYVPGTAGDMNERCMMARLRLNSYSVLITGDSPMAAERELLRSHELGDVNALVVGHHGSNYSSSEHFLRDLNGDVAIISVGYNHFGHPAEETLERLFNCGYNVYRTDEDGTVEIRIS